MSKKKVAKKATKKAKSKFSREKFEKAGWTFEERKTTSHYRTSPDCYYKSPRMESIAYIRTKFDDPTFTDKLLLEEEYERFCNEMRDKAISEYYEFVDQNVKENYQPLTI